MERIILHSDLNNFFASVECVLNPEYTDKYIAVCGSQSDRHGIVLAKNQRAKLCGVKTGDTIWEARRKCPEILVVPPHFDQYKKYSEAVRQIYLEYTDEVEAFGMDECWLDVSKSILLFGSGRSIAEQIRCEIKEKTGLTVSIGVSFNKIFAKLCSDMQKPDAVTEVTRKQYKERIWPLPASYLLGVGRSTENILQRHGIFTIGDIASIPCDMLTKWLGKSGAMLHAYANGMDLSKVSHSDYDPQAQSVSRGVTCRENLTERSEISKVALFLAQDISQTLRKHSYIAGGVAIHLRFSDLTHTEFSERLNHPTRSSKIIFETAMRLLDQSFFSKEVRAVTVRTFGISSDSEPVVIDLFTDARREEKFEKKEACADAIRARFGKGAIIPASLMGDFKLPAILNESRLPGCMRR